MLREKKKESSSDTEDLFRLYEQPMEVGDEIYRRRLPELRERLLDVQRRLADAEFPVILLFAGVDGAGKGESANLLNAWMDPRRIVTRSFARSTDEELQRPPYWRFWRALPPKGRIGLFLSAWYTEPLLSRVYGEIDDEGLDRRLDAIARFERTLVDDGALILKCWLHLGKEAQKDRLQALADDPLRSWRVTERDWVHWRMYDTFVEVSERIITRTGTDAAPWRIVEGSDEKYRSLEVGMILLENIEDHLSAWASGRHKAVKGKSPLGAEPAPEAEPDGSSAPAAGGVLATLDMGQKLKKEEYQTQLVKAQGKLNRLFRWAREQKVPTVLVFEGWDAAGKGGTIRRLISALDARDYRVILTGAPSDEERDQHYLWRFWRRLPRAGRLTIFDRSWYGRVLVERVEGFATAPEWRRAYDEIRDFERQLVDYGTVLVKYWIHITKEEQRRRFKARKETPHKRWKLTQEDWRNRKRWDDYEMAVDEMIARTHSEQAPWVLVEGNDKRFARIKVIDALCHAYERVL